MLDRTKILKQAIHDCMAEMYAKAQPMADYDNLIEEYKAGKIGKDEKIYERHYLSQEEFNYILEKYKKAYRLVNEWNSDLDVVLNYLIEGGTKDKYIEEVKDENGKIVEPGHRGYEKVEPIKTQILNIVKDEEVASKLTDIVIGTINDCKKFYCFDREDSDFSVAIALGASPTSNPETVKQWWKENYDVDVEIEERNPLLLWDMDEYGDEFEDIMKEEYGENWKKIWDKRWEEEQEKRNKEIEEKYKEFLEKYKIDEN